MRVQKNRYIPRDSRGPIPVEIAEQPYLIPVPVYPALVAARPSMRFFHDPSVRKTALPEYLLRRDRYCRRPACPLFAW